MKFRCQKRQAQERGYILLTLLLVVALLSIGILTQIQSMAFQIKRDREEELIHRGVEYSRAVRRFCARFKRFPASVEELESTNNYRCLRKRYKDPITGKDFKPVSLTEFEASLPGASTPPPTAPAPQAPEVQYRQDIPRESDGGVFSNSADSNGGDAPAAAGNPNPDDDDTNGAPPLHGVPIVGVVSLSKQKSIREFDGKDHYNQWLFIYNPKNPNNTRAGLISTPDEPSFESKAQARGSQK
ncbi:MAG: hypothetical protein ACLPTQ_24045 [Terriglobales bacterium]